MKKLLALAIVGAMVMPAMADVYTDTVGDTFAGVGGGGILDIVSVEVTNDLTDINFEITLNADVTATDWGKYLVIIDSAPGGDTAGNGWGRPFSMASGADYFIGSWVDSGTGAELYDYTGAWNLTEATYNAAPDNDISVVAAGSTVTLSTPIANMGLVAGDTIAFDVVTTGGGGGDGAIDSLGNPNQQVGDWGEASTVVPVSYTLVPEPGALALLALGALTLIRRK